MATSSFSSTKFPPAFPGNFHSRKFFLLLENLQDHQTITAAAPPAYPTKSSLHVNLGMFLLILALALVGSLGFHFVIRFVFSWFPSVSATESNANSSSTSSVKIPSGLMENDLQDFPVVTYSEELKLPGLDTECVICLGEFAPDELVRILPKCNHGFHVLCIDLWLRSHSSCPKCRQRLIEASQKIEGA